MAGDSYILQCCNDSQVTTICFIIGYSVIILKCWRLPILHPFKILTVFLHELGHATAVWMTCGRVTGMEVHPDEGGVTKHTGGIAIIVLPAGYLGSAVWGMGCVIASSANLGAQIAAGILIFFLLVFVIYAHNSYLRVLNISFAVILGGLLVLDIYTGIYILRYVILFLGVMSCLFSIYDIWDDLISRRVNESDASKFAAITHTSSRCWGVIWALIAVITLIIAIYVNLLIQNGGSSYTVKDGNALALGALCFACATVGLSLLHTLVYKEVMIKRKPHHSGNFYFGGSQ